MRTTGGSKTCYGVMTDRLGSLMSLYTAEGIVQKFSYDAWGNRRNPLTGAPLSSAELVAANSITSRGYTSHEHIDEFGLINMNARIYDAKLGMFVSVDPQADNYLETYPYAYCAGDPLNRVDLTGEDWYEDKNGNLYWQEGHEDLDGYTRLGSSVSIQFGDNTFFNAYQNAGVIANQAVNAFDLIYMSQKLQNQFLGKDSPLSEASKSELFNGLNSRSMDAIARPVGEALFEYGSWQLGGELLGNMIGWGANRLSKLLGKKAAEELSKSASSVLTKSEYIRIKNAATRIGLPINVVGSRASGTANAFSDWDYIIEGINRYKWNKIKNSLPGARSVLDNMPRNIDLIKEPLNRTKPYITIYPN